MRKFGDRCTYNYPQPRLLKSLKVQSLKVMVIANSPSPLIILENGKYNKLEPDEAGIIRSQEFSGLWLNVTAILNNDMSAVLKTLQTGLSSQ